MQNNVIEDTKKQLDGVNRRMLPTTVASRQRAVRRRFLAPIHSRSPGLAAMNSHLTHSISRPAPRRAAKSKFIAAPKSHSLKAGRSIRRPAHDRSRRRACRILTAIRRRQRVCAFDDDRGSRRSHDRRLLEHGRIGACRNSRYDTAPRHSELVLAFYPTLFGDGDLTRQTETAERLFAAITTQGARLP